VKRAAVVGLVTLSALIARVLWTACGLPAALAPDLVLIVLVALAARVRPVAALTVAFVSGLAEGALTAEPAGAAALSRIGVVLAVLVLGDVVELGDRRVALGAVFGASILASALDAAAARMLGLEAPMAPLGMLGGALTTLLAALLGLMALELVPALRSRRRLAW